MRNQTGQVVGTLVMAGLLMATGCTSKSAAREEAKKGAAYGALGGAVSGFFWGLFSGNPIGRAAQGAAVGGATGATLGAVHGSSEDRDLKEQYGDTNYKGLMALVARDYPAAKAYAAQTVNDPNPNYRHASAWLSVLIATETLGKEELDPYYQKLIELDPNISELEDARVEVRLAERDLRSLRKQRNAR